MSFIGQLLSSIAGGAAAAATGAAGAGAAGALGAGLTAGTSIAQVASAIGGTGAASGGLASLAGNIAGAALGGGGNKGGGGVVAPTGAGPSGPAVPSTPKPPTASQENAQSQPSGFSRVVRAASTPGGVFSELGTSLPGPLGKAAGLIGDSFDPIQGNFRADALFNEDLRKVLSQRRKVLNSNTEQEQLLEILLGMI